MNPVKLIVSSKNNLRFKYGKSVSVIEKALAELEKSDSKKGLDTKVVYIDDAASAGKAGIRAIGTMSPKKCKKAIDELYAKHTPAYIAILGAQDVVPFQDITNPAEDNDTVVPTDLPYACDAPFSTNIASFTGPTRVVGRIPDIPGKKDAGYLKTLIQNSFAHVPLKADQYRKYFSVSAWVWRKSTEQSLHNMFGQHNNLQLSPPKNGGYTKTQLKPRTHFYNCHGATGNPSYFGQRGSSFPEAIRSSALLEKVPAGTVVAAECCYGAELIDPALVDREELSVANTYLNTAIAFLGSSTIAYGPAEGQGLADLITQYFIKSILRGATSGRAFLEARQKFLEVSGPQLDPYELKTFAQFYLLGDPSVKPAICEVNAATSNNTTENRRIRLFSKGIGLKKTITPAKKISEEGRSSDVKGLNALLKKTAFDKVDKVGVYEVKSKGAGASELEKKMMGEDALYRTYIKPGPETKVCDIKVLVVKENKEQLLGWKMYASK